MTFDAESWRREASALQKDLLAANPTDFGWHGDGRHEYGELNENLWVLLRAANITAVPADYRGWQETRDAKPQEVGWYGSASLDDIAMAAIYLQRGEHFYGGFWLLAFEQGLFNALIDRLVILTNELPYDAAASSWTNRNHL